MSQTKKKPRVVAHRGARIEIPSQGIPMTKHKGAEPIPQAAHDRIVALQNDLDDAMALCEWQRRSLSRLKALICQCQDQRRAPTSAEISEALHDGTRMAA